MLEVFKDGELIDTITPFQRVSIPKECLEGKKMYKGVSLYHYKYSLREDGVYWYSTYLNDWDKITELSEGFIHFYLDMETVLKELKWYYNTLNGEDKYFTSKYYGCVCQTAVYKCVIPANTPYCDGFFKDSSDIKSGCAQEIRFVEKIDSFAI